MTKYDRKTVKNDRENERQVPKNGKITLKMTTPQPKMTKGVLRNGENIDENDRKKIKEKCQKRQYNKKMTIKRPK